ncbi:hypothetical protein SCHPADRAFT_517002 [Schizopora paradoxa]|uniref:Uncharacterized protein n=1 Tax=Schizopora paradoxa TaxID=27342 RepID=A0A0H2RG03_9AGAM|nr:hypothetical protein SCHPADRAFT_517002 [Schizopora paradoxa]
MSNLENLCKVFSGKKYVTIHSVEFPSNGGARPNSVFALIGDKEVETKRYGKNKNVWNFPERTIAFDDEKLRIQLRLNNLPWSRREKLIWEPEGPEQTEELAVSEFVTHVGTRNPTDSSESCKLIRTIIQTKE